MYIKYLFPQTVGLFEYCVLLSWLLFVYFRLVLWQFAHRHFPLSIFPLNGVFGRANVFGFTEIELKISLLWVPCLIVWSSLSGVWTFSRGSEEFYGSCLTPKVVICWEHILRKLWGQDQFLWAITYAVHSFNPRTRPCPSYFTHSFIKYQLCTFVWVCFQCLVVWLILNFWGRLLLHRSGASIPSLRPP